VNRAEVAFQHPFRAVPSTGEAYLGVELCGGRPEVEERAGARGAGCDLLRRGRGLVRVHDAAEAGHQLKKKGPARAAMGMMNLLVSNNYGAGSIFGAKDRS